MKLNIGRNEPCPCGSGKKFKRCCIDNPVDLFPQHFVPGQYRWSQEDIRKIPTEKIVEKLKMCGVEFEEGEFLNDVVKVNSAKEIYDGWKAEHEITAEGFDINFVWMACEILWERLAAGKPSTEQLDEMMQKGYELIETRDAVGACRLWLKVWEELKKRFTPDMKSIEDAEIVFKGCHQRLCNWCQDLEMELGNAGIDDKDFYEHQLQYCREFCELFPDSDELIIHNMRRAVGESLFMTQRREESEIEFQKLVDDFPDNVWGYISWGDMYFRVGRFFPPDLDRAEELYRMALGKDPDEDEAILERLEDLEKEREAG